MDRPKDYLHEKAAGGSGDSDPSRRARDFNNRGVLLQMDGDLEGARAGYLTALELDPENATALNNLGFLIAQEGRLEEAARYYQRALEIDPNRTMPWTNLGNTRA